MQPIVPPLLKSSESFTGFVAHYTDGRRIYERENFFSDKLNRKCATNWTEVDRDRLAALELVWKGTVKARIDKIPTATSFNTQKSLTPPDWFFSQKGYLDMGRRETIVIARNIGYKENGVLHIASVFEETGILRIYDRAESTTND